MFPFGSFSTRFILNLHLCSDRSFWKGSWCCPCCSSQQRIIPVFTAARPENHEHPGWTFSLDPCAQRFLLILWNLWGFPPLQVILLLLLSVAFSAINLFFYLLQLWSLQHRLSDKPQRAMIITKESFIKDWWYSRDISFTGSLLASTDRVTDKRKSS